MPLPYTLYRRTFATLLYSEVQRTYHHSSRKSVPHYRLARNWNQTLWPHGGHYEMPHGRSPHHSTSCLQTVAFGSCLHKLGRFFLLLYAADSTRLSNIFDLLKDTFRTIYRIQGTFFGISFQRPSHNLAPTLPFSDILESSIFRSIPEDFHRTHIRLSIITLYTKSNIKSPTFITNLPANHTAAMNVINSMKSARPFAHSNGGFACHISDTNTKYPPPF